MVQEDTMTIEHTCRAKVWHGYASYSCGKKAKHEHEGHWYCKTHHPPTVEAKYKARENRFQQEWAAKRERDALEAAQKAEQQRRATLYPDLIQAMRDIARQPEGDELSAQAVARAMLKMCGEDAP
jgi:hypothetical protein